jgi:hypothetical protein
MTSASTSGQLRPFTARELIEEATSRCGINQTQLTSEIIEKSLDQLNMMFPAMLNRGIQLWKRQRMILPCYENERRINLPEGVNVASKVTRRSLMRAAHGTPFVDEAAGDPALAFDGDFNTSCNQTRTNGKIGMLFDQGVQVTTLGVKFNISMELSYFLEYLHDDGLTWIAIEGVTGVTRVGQWVWTDIDGAPSSKGWRIRASVPIGPVQLPVTMDVQEVFFGHTPSEINIEPWNLDDYNSMPNKTAPGRVVNYYQQRNLDAPYLLVWPVPDASAKFDQIICWAQEYLDTVSEPTQALDVPRRWYDAITAELARRLCRSLPEADMSRYSMLKAEEMEALALAVAEERDDSPTNYDMGLDSYTA